MSTAPPSDELTAFRLEAVEKGQDALTKKVDRLMWAIVTLAFSITSSAIIFAITAASLK